MKQNDVSERLRALATDDKRRPETARLRDVFNDVEAALTAGISQADVLAELHKSGYTMTMASFKSALQRIRKERSKNQATSPGEKPATATVGAAPEGSEKTSQTDDDLSSLDKKQRRERLGDQFIKNEPTNPLLKRLQEQKK